LVAYLDKLVGGVGIGISPDERGGEIGPSAVVSAAVGIQALQSKVLLHPRCVLEGVGFQEWHDVVLDGDVLAASHRQMLEGIDARGQDAPNQRNSSHGRVTEVQASQSCAVGRYDLLQQGVERVGLGLPFPVLGRLVARGAHCDGGLGQSEGERLPCERVALQELAQVMRCVVEFEEGEGGDLGEEGLEYGRIGGDDGFKQTEGGSWGGGVAP
jgi:hypothetical protein